MANSLPNNNPAEKRRSSRIEQAVPVTVLGVDALGRPFQERTSTMIVNCHGCRYQSKHYVLKNMWITLEVPHPEAGHEPRCVRGRVTWIQRPRTVRELFQVGVDLEVGGNLWGIAFPPPDWFGFPEGLPALREIPASTIGGGMLGLAPESAHMHLSAADFGVVSDELAGDADNQDSTELPAAEAPLESNLRTMPSGGTAPSAGQGVGAGSSDDAGSSGFTGQTADPGPSGATGSLTAEADPSLVAARQMMRLVSEAKQQLQSTARESAVQAVHAETRPLIAALHRQMEEAARQAVANAADQTLASTTERAVQGALDQTAQASEARLEQLREHWDSQLAASIEHASQTLGSRINEVEQERRSAFLQELEAETRRAIENLQRVTQEFQGRLNEAQSGADQIVRQAQEAAAPAIQEIEQRMQTHAEEARAQFDEFVRAARQWNEQMASAASASELNWQARLEADLDAAGSRWNEQIESSMARATQQAEERLAQHSRETADRVERETGARMTTLAEVLASANAEAEQRLTSLRETLDQQTTRTQAVLDQVQAAAREVEARTQQLESLDRTALQEMERRSTSLLEAHTEELNRRAEKTLAAWTEQLRPAMEDAGQQTVTRLGAQLETEFGSRLERANQLLGKLETGTHALEETLRKHDHELGQISEKSMQAAISRMQGAVDQLEHSLEESSRDVAAKWLAEIEAKATETTHTTFESLFKTAEWYEKKVHTQMQSALDKGMEQTGEVLRKRAGEISGMFAAELDHYSRSYVEHTQGQIEESGRATVDGVRKQSADAAAASAAVIQQQTHNQTEAALSQIRNKAGVTVTQTSSQLEALAAQARAKFEADMQRAQTEFRAMLLHDAQETVSKSRQELAGQAELAKEDLRAEGKRQESQLRQTLGVLGDQFIENYKKRLENASNSWLLTTVSRLNQQSAQQLDELSRSAESRLRATCGQVFASVGETLRRRLADVSVPAIGNAIETPAERTGENAVAGFADKSTPKHAQ